VNRDGTAAGVGMLAARSSFVSDVELGNSVPAPATFCFDERLLASFSNYLAGSLVLLFVAGVLPLSILFLASVLLVCLSTCIRAHVMHRLENSLEREQRLSSLSEVIQVLSAAGPLLSSQQPLGLASLRLALVARDFDESDYEALLALDAENRQPLKEIPDNLLAKLSTFKHTRKGKKRKRYCNDSACCVCLEEYKEGETVCQLLCQHSFHSDCIHPWLRQQGPAVLCPLCKAGVWQGCGEGPGKCDCPDNSRITGDELALVV